MDPEKDLLDIPTELEIPIEEEKVESPVEEEIVETPVVEENILEEVPSESEIINNNQDSLGVPDVNNDVNLSEDLANNTEVISNEVLDNPIVQSDVSTTEGLDNSQNVGNEAQEVINEPNTISELIQQDSLNVEELNPSMSVDSVDNSVVDSQVNNLSLGTAESNTISDYSNNDNSSVTVNPGMNEQLPVDNMLGSETLNNDVGIVTPSLETPVADDTVNNSFATQSVPIIQPLDSTTPPEELDIKVDDTKKKKPRKKFSIVKLLIILLLIAGIGVAAYIFVPKFLSNEQVEEKDEYLKVIGVTFKDSIDSAYSFIKPESMDGVSGENGMYSVDSEHVVLTKSDESKFNIILKDIYVTDVVFFASYNGVDYLKSSDMFGNTYLYGVSNITKDIELDYEKDIITVPSGVDLATIEMGIYTDGRGVFFISRSENETKIIEKGEKGYVLSALSSAMLRGQELSISSLNLSKKLNEKINLTGAVFEYTGGVYVYDDSDGADAIYPLNDVEDIAFNAKEVYLVSNSKESTVDLYIFFEKDGKEYINIVDLIESDFANGNAKLSNYSKAVKSKELSDEKILITLEDGSTIAK